MLNKPFIHIFFPIILIIILNLIRYLFGINIQIEKSKKPNKLFPPGYIIGIIWLIIFGLLGYAHYLIYMLKNGFSFASLSIVFMLLFSISYPFLIRLGFKIGLIINLITLILSFILGIIIIIESKYIFLYIIPLLLWASYVNIVDTIDCSTLQHATSSPVHGWTLEERIR